MEELGLPLIGTAFAGASPYSNCFLVTKTCVQSSSIEELEKNLQGNIIVSGAAAAELEKRGLGRYIGNVHAELQRAVAQDTFIEHRFCQGYEKLKYHAMGETIYFFRFMDSPAFEVVTRFRNKDGEDFGAGTLLMTRPDGTRVALIGCNFGSHALSSGRAALLNRIANWVSHEKLPIMLEEPGQMLLLPRISADGTLRNVTIINPTICPQKEIALLLKRIPEHVKTVKWFIPASTPAELTVQRKDSCCRIIIPELAAWNVGFIEFES